MALLVRNERDIVELNVRFHASKGVEAFIIIDNGSVDGTYEIAKRLAREFAVKVLQYHDDSFQQSRWMTHAAMLAWDEFDADLVIPNDADEFWMPNNGGSIETSSRVIPPPGSDRNGDAGRRLKMMTSSKRNSRT